MGISTRLFEWKIGLIENHMSRDEHSLSRWMKALITFMLVTVSHKDTWDCLWIKLIFLSVPSVWKAFRTKYSKERVIWMHAL